MHRRAMTHAPTPAHLGVRLLAILYDGLLLTGLLFIAAWLWLPLTGGEAVGPGDPLYRPFQLYLLGVAFAFFGGFWLATGQTLGMMAWRLRVVREDGGRLKPRQALVRFFAAIVSWLLLGGGFLYSLLDGERRALHDIASGTRLVREPKR